VNDKAIEFSAKTGVKARSNW